ncbi:MAG: DUF4143 domain-containing protein, partial [Fretibacterium sp.]|nr:DUF4143 domain-containing protein [Fretibacterium sp.]
EASYIIHLLEADSNSLGRTLIKSPKLYFIDSGLLCHLLRLEGKEDLLLSPHKGAAVETFAVSELLKGRMNVGKRPNLTYFRDKNGFEVDTIADWKHTFAIEIKSNSGPEAALSGNIRKYLALRKEANAVGAVFYLGDVSMSLNGIEYVSWRDWGDFAAKNPPS